MHCTTLRLLRLGRHPALPSLSLLTYARNQEQGPALSPMAQFASDAARVIALEAI